MNKVLEQKYIIDMQLAGKFLVRNHNMNYPIKAFENWTGSSLGNSIGLWVVNPFAFYKDYNDLIDGKNIIKISYQEYYGIAWQPNKILEEVNALFQYLRQSNFRSLTEEELEELYYLIELLKEAAKENLIISCSLVE